MVRLIYFVYYFLSVSALAFSIFLIGKKGVSITVSAGCAVYAYGMYLIHCLLQVYWMNGYKSTKKSYTYQNECAIYVKVKIEE